MTIFHPRTTHAAILSIALAALAAVSGALVVYLVVLYNQTADMEHSLAALGRDIEALEAENAELEDGLFALFDSAHLEEFAAERNLVKDPEPEYLTTREAWELASQY